jgi:ribonuclease R
LIEDIVASERNIAHRIIEEFMLLANETVAHHLESHHMPALYRIHEQPDPLKVLQFEEFVASLGYTLAIPATGAKPMHFQKLVEQIRGRPEERPIALLMLRTMQKARYDAMNVGHFGLAAPTYTHFTSPIRRYPDLVVHRLLRELRHKHVPAERKEELAEDLPEIGRHTSEMERRADEAERELVQWKKVRFMADKVGDIFDGYITGVAPFGLFVELVEHYVEGMIHVSSMADDYYRYSETAHTLFGENTKKKYRLGDRVTVQVVRVDLDKRQIDLGLEDVLAAVRQDERRRGPVRGQARVKKAKRKGTPEERRKLALAARRNKKKQRPGRRERAARKNRT